MTRRQLRRKKRTPERVLASLLARYKWNLLFEHGAMGRGRPWYRLVAVPGRVVGSGNTPHEAIRSVPPK